MRGIYGKPFWSFLLRLSVFGLSALPKTIKENFIWEQPKSFGQRKSCWVRKELEDIRKQHNKSRGSNLQNKRTKKSNQTKHKGKEASRRRVGENERWRKEKKRGKRAATNPKRGRRLEKHLHCCLLLIPLKTLSFLFLVDKQTLTLFFAYFVILII